MNLVRNIVVASIAVISNFTFAIGHYGEILMKDGYAISTNSVSGYNKLYMSKGRNNQEIYFDEHFKENGGMFAGGSSHLSVKQWKHYKAPQNFNERVCLNAYKPAVLSRVSIYKCDRNDKEQRWTIIHIPDEPMGFLIKLVGTNLCLNTYRIKEGSSLTLYTCDVTDTDQIFSDYLD